MDSVNALLTFATTRLLVKINMKDLKTEITAKNLYFFLVSDQREMQSSVKRIKLKAFMKEQDEHTLDVSLTRNV